MSTYLFNLFSFVCSSWRSSPIFILSCLLLSVFTSLIHLRSFILLCTFSLQIAVDESDRYLPTFSIYDPWIFGESFDHRHGSMFSFCTSYVDNDLSLILW